MKIFVRLVDSNAQVAAYKKILGITKKDIAEHIPNMGVYRRLSAISYEIKMLFKAFKIDREQIKVKRKELNEVLKEWKNGKV